MIKKLIKRLLKEGKYEVSNPFENDIEYLISIGCENPEEVINN